jgi:DNA repair protein RadC
LQSGLEGFLDYEIVELLLTLGTPRRDCKQMAKQVIKKFGGLRGALDATIEDLQQINGIGPENAFGLKLFQAISERYVREKIPPKISLDSPQAVVNYLKKKLGRENKEHFVVLLLGSHNNLLSIKDISVGTLNSSLVHPREVFEPAVKNLAARIIIAHNHPSGDPMPSKEDVEITKDLVTTGRVLDIEVLDHIIITKLKHFSFKEKKLI